jgi:hypothetical protein
MQEPVALAEATIRRYINNGLGFQLFDRWIALSESFSPTAYKHLVVAIARASEDIPADESILSQDPTDRAIAFLYVLLELGARANQDQHVLARIVVEESSSLEFARQFLLFANSNNNVVLTRFDKLRPVLLRWHFAKRVLGVLEVQHTDPFQAYGRRGAYVLAAIGQRGRAARIASLLNRVELVLEAYSSSFGNESRRVQLRELCADFDPREFRVNPAQLRPDLRQVLEAALSSSDCTRDGLPFHTTAGTSSNAMPFDVWLRATVVGVDNFSAVTAFLLQWDHHREDLAREPSLGEYAERWGLTLHQASQSMDIYRSAFGAVDPGRVLDELWFATSSRDSPPDVLQDLMKVPVVPNFDRATGGWAPVDAGEPAT